MTLIKNTPFTFKLVRRIDPFKNSTWPIELGLFTIDEPSTGIVPAYIGAYRPETGDYLLYKASSSHADMVELENILKTWAFIETQDEVFQILHHMIDFLHYSPVLKETAFWCNSNDSQYNLLGSIMSVNNKLLLGHCCAPEIDGTSTPWTIGPMTGCDKMDIIIRFHEELIRMGQVVCRNLFQNSKHAIQ